MTKPDFTTWNGLCSTLKNVAVSTDTMRREDVIPAMVRKLKDLIHVAWRLRDVELAHLSVPVRARMWSDLNDIQTCLTKEGYWEEYDATAEHFVILEEHLNAFSPEGYEFGTHPDDGAWVGWYPTDKSREGNFQL